MIVETRPRAVTKEIGTNTEKEVETRDRNESKSGLASPNFYLLDLAKFLSFINKFLFESSLTSGNNLVFPGFPQKISDNLDEKNRF